MPTVTMIGGGQLARMTHQSAIALGQCLRVLAGSADEPAAQVSANVVLGSHDDLEALRAAAEGAVALTFDHEGVPLAHLEALEADGVQVRPPSKALHFAQDKMAMRKRLSELGLPVPAFVDLSGEASAAREALIEFGESQDWQVVIKAVSGGYDGRGVWITDTRDEALAAFDSQVGGDVVLMAEQKIEMARELSAMVARSPYGQGAAWPVVETVQRKGQCAVVIAPAPGLDPDVAEKAQQMSLTLADELGVVGAMAMELFETVDGDLIVNELAMRPHNSGHWSQDGAVTGQFEQHLRAIADLPLGDVSPRAPWSVMVNILGGPADGTISDRFDVAMAECPDAKIHTYGKAARPGRKVGHVNVTGEDLDDAVYTARAAAAHFD